MKFTFHQRSFLLCLCTIFCLPITVARSSAQSQPPPVLLALKACDRELRVFDDGAMIETRRGKTTQRRLSERELRKLRGLIAHRPCIMEWQQPTSPQPNSASEEVKLSTTSNEGCMMDWRSYIGPGLDEIQVTIPSLGSQIGTIPVYVVCDHAKESYKEAAKRDYQRYLKPNWQRFLADASKAVGSKSFLKGCYCWQS